MDSKRIDWSELEKMIVLKTKTVKGVIEIIKLDIIYIFHNESCQKFSSIMVLYKKWEMHLYPQSLFLTGEPPIHYCGFLN